MLPSRIVFFAPAALAASAGSPQSQSGPSLRNRNAIEAVSSSQSAVWSRDLPHLPKKDETDKPQEQVQGKNFDDMIQDPEGFFHLADDGVQRSYDASGNVIDYRQLSNAEIMAMIAALPATRSDMAEHLYAEFAETDGTTVTDEAQLLNPPKHLQPQGGAAGSQEGIAAPKSDSPAHSAKRDLEGRSLYCLGKECTSTSACTFLGCHICQLYDRVFRLKVCLV